MYRAIVIAIVVITSFSLFTVGAVAEGSENVSYQLPEVRLTPDLPLYFLKRVKEEVGKYLKFSIEEKINYQLQLADTRLAESLSLMEKEKYKVAGKMFEAYEGEIGGVEGKLRTGDVSPIKGEVLRQRAEKSLHKYLAILEEMDRRNIEEEVAKEEVKEIQEKHRASAGRYLQSVLSAKISSKDYSPPFLSPIPLGRGL